MRVCFFPPAYFNCILTLTAMRRLRWERVGWEKKMWSHFCCKKKGMLELHLHSICSCFYSGSAEQKICFSQEYIKTLAHCNLEYLPSGCVSTLLGSCYQYQLKEVLPFSWADTAGKWIGKMI